jgi:hypothetical protein
MKGWMDEWIGLIDGWMDEWMDGSRYGRLLKLKSEDKLL